MSCHCYSMVVRSMMHVLFVAMLLGLTQQQALAADNCSASIGKVTLNEYTFISNGKYLEVRKIDPLTDITGWTARVYTSTKKSTTKSLVSCTNTSFLTADFTNAQADANADVVLFDAAGDVVDLVRTRTSLLPITLPFYIPSGICDFEGSTTDVYVPVQKFKVDRVPDGVGDWRDTDTLSKCAGTGAVDLNISKSVNASTLEIDDPVVFTITVNNPPANANDAYNVVVNDFLPLGLAYFSSSVSMGSYAPLTGIWTIGTLPSGASATMTLTASALALGTYTNTATVSTDSFDTNTADNTASVNVTIVAATPAARLDAVEVAAAPVTHIFTKLAAQGFNLDLLALNADNSINTKYQKTVIVELVDGSSSSNCAVMTLLQTVGTHTFTGNGVGKDNGRKTFAFNYPNAASNVRIRLRDLVTPITSCSTDNFAIRPSIITLSTSAIAIPPSIIAAPVIKAGNNFSLSASTSPVANYAGSLVLDASKLTAQTPAQADTVQTGGVVGTLTPVSFSANTGVINATYSEVGFVYLAPGAYRDEAFTAVDSIAGDCVTDTTDDNNLSDVLIGGKYGCHIGNKVAISLGRFIPNHYETSLVNGCGATGSEFTYSAQPFNNFKVSAFTLGGTGVTGVTHNYSGVYGKAFSLSDANAVNGGALSVTNVAAAAFTNGVYTNNNLTYTFTPHIHAPATVKLHAEETAAGDGVASLLEATSQIRAGRARVLNAFGSELLDLAMSMSAQYWKDAVSGWQPNIADNCTDATLAFTAVGTPDITANTCVWDTGIAPGNSGIGCTVATPAGRQYKEVGVTGFAGDFNLWLKAPGAGHARSIDVTATVPTWLQYNWTGAVGNPKGRATFGVYRSKSDKVIHRREMY